MTSEDIRHRARRELTEATSMETADYLLERPPGGWDSLATKDNLKDSLAILDANLRGEIHKSLRDQTWRLGAALIAVGGLVATIIKL
jgi:hypothetical protein